MKNKKILYIVIVVLIVGGGLFFFLNKNKVLTPTADKKTVDLAKKIPNFAVLKTRQPKPDSQLAISSTISAAKGGEISLSDSKGVLVKLSIPAGSLSQDTDITLSPLQEVPIENYTSKLGNGILIEPEGLKFSQNASLTFDFKPGKAGQPSETLNSLPKKAGIVHVDSLKDRINNTYAIRSKYGSKLFASIGSASSFVPDDLSGSNGEAVAESELPAAAADLGVCSQQFLNAATKIIEYAQAVGDNETANGVYEVLQDCGKKMVDDLENKCKENPMQLRRRDFVNVMEIVQAIGPLEEAQRAEKLMMDCRREYSITSSKSAIIQQGTSTYSIDAEVCGYLDEQWEGQEIADYSILGAHQRYTGAITFTLPRDGGEFDMTTAGELLAQSRFTADMTFPFSGQGQSAFYDNQKKIIVHYVGYGIFDVDAPITVKDNKCITTNEELNQAGW